MATDFCKEHKQGLYSPHYNYDFGKKRKKHRDGCSLCVHATQAERDQYFRDYPEAIPIVIELQNIVKEKRPERAPLRGYKWFIESQNTIKSQFKGDERTILRSDKVEISINKCPTEMV